MKIIYEPVFYEINLKKVKNALKGFKDYFLVYTAQHYKIFKDWKNSGLILGCNCDCVTSSKFDIIIFVGEGRFHALNIKKNNPEKKVYTLNSNTFKINEILLSDVKKFINREAINLERLKSAKKIGIISTLKKGQENIKIAELIKKKLELEDKKVYSFISNTINPDEFLNFSKLDILINTACPRIGLDDYTKFNVPIINHEVVLTKHFNKY